MTAMRHFEPWPQGRGFFLVRTEATRRDIDNRSMLWVKAFHIVFVASWFAGLFYLPRIFVNLALEDSPEGRARLLLMARKLYRFMTMLAVPALAFGLWLWLGYGVGKNAGWLHAKLAIVVLII